MFFHLFSAVVIPLAYGVATSNTDYGDHINNRIETSESIDSESESVSYPIYDDENYCITLSAYQLNNYTFENFYNVINPIFEIQQDGGVWGAWYYNGNLADVDEMTSEYAIQSIDGNFIKFNTYGNYYPSDTYKFYFEDSLNELVDFEYSLELDFSVFYENYSVLKNAIQLDIQYNMDNMPSLVNILNDIVTLLTSGIVNIGRGIATGINSIITTLMITDGNMSVFVGVVAIFGGIALAVGLTRKIFGWIESLGARR